MKNFFNLGGFSLNNDYSPYIIAEIGVNHEGSLELAKKLILQARNAGAHAVKFQSYKAEKIASKNSPAYWDITKESTESQYKLFKKYDSFGEKEYIELYEFCKSIGVDFSSTPFDLDAVDFLDPIVPFFKIASADITNIPLLRKVAKTNKPIILSTGASTLPEIMHAVNELEASGAKEIALLHCVLNYPTPMENANLNGIKALEKAFPHIPIGYSDHVVPDQTMSALEVAVLFGACIIEKHFTHDKALPGNDHYHAMDESDLKSFLEKLNKYQLMIGSGRKNLELERKAIIHARRSIVASKKLPVGTIIDESMIIAKRPGHGISPLHWDEVVGKRVVSEILDDELISWSKLN